MIQEPNNQITIADGGIYRDNAIIVQCFGEDRDAIAQRIVELEQKLAESEQRYNLATLSLQKLRAAHDDSGGF